MQETAVMTMKVACPMHTYGFEEPPPTIIEAIERRKTLYEEASAATNGTIMERLREREYLEEDDLCHALICAGIHNHYYPLAVRWANFIICGAAITVLNTGHPIDLVSFLNTNPFDLSWDLFCQSLWQIKEDKPLHVDTAAALCELFKTTPSDSRLVDHAVSSGFIACYSGFSDSIWSNYGNLKLTYIKDGPWIIQESLPIWAQEDAHAIARAVPDVIHIVMDYLKESPSSY